MKILKYIYTKLSAFLYYINWHTETDNFPGIVVFTMAVMIFLVPAAIAGVLIGLSIIHLFVR